MLSLAILLVASSPSIVPKPQSLAMGQGSYLLRPDSSVEASGPTEALGHMLQQELSPATGYMLNVVGRRGRTAIRLRVDRRLQKLGPEGYHLEVAKDHIDIVGYEPAGVFYGMQTLRQLFPPAIFRKSKVENVEWSVPCLSIDDSPRFAWRGAMMDVSRHFMPKQFVLKFLDLMALHKLNVFHWHLTDDNGWRIEIKKYPRFTQVASDSDFSSMNPKEATRSKSIPPGGFFTQDDIREVVRYAADRYITIVPEIEMPGHAAAAIKAYPELGNRQEITKAGLDASSVPDNVYNVSDSTIAVLQDVLTEVMDLFPGKFIHVGGDEVDKEPWQKNPKAQERIKSLGLKNDEELESWFIHQFDTFLTQKGRRLIGWDEILEGGLAPGATVMSWRGIDGGIAAAQQNHDVVMAPTDYTYLDYYQSADRKSEPRAMGGFLPLKTVYSYEPIPKQLSPEQAKHVLGVQGQLWAEFIPEARHEEYMAFPRLCALSEIAWSSGEGKDYNAFLDRLKLHLDRLKILDVHYRPLDTAREPAATWIPSQMSEQPAVLTWNVSRWITEAGRHTVQFQYTQGADRLMVDWVELLQDGTVVARDEHAGFTGGESENNTYALTLAAYKPGATYTLRAQVHSDGGTESTGDIYIGK